jgi:hypothetical protein
MPCEPLLLKTEELAVLLGISVAKAKQKIGTGEIESVLIDSSRRIPLVCAVEYVERLRAEQNGTHTRNEGREKALVAESISLATPSDQEGANGVDGT